MISLQDCIALCGLDEEEILAIAEHEHIPEMCAAALATRLLGQSHGPDVIRDMIVDDIRDAYARGDQAHLGELLHCLRHFLHEHPEAVLPGQAATDNGTA